MLGVVDNIERALAALAEHRGWPVSDRRLAMHYLSRAIAELGKSVGETKRIGDGANDSPVPH
jgi:hypothetical protein